MRNEKGRRYSASDDDEDDEQKKLNAEPGFPRRHAIRAGLLLLPRGVLGLLLLAQLLQLRLQRRLLVDHVLLVRALQLLPLLGFQLGLRVVIGVGDDA